MTDTGVSSVGGVIVLSIVTGGAASALVIPVSIALGSLTLVINFVDGILSETLSSKRKKKYHELMKMFEQAKNELFLFQQKALLDGKLDDGELQILHEIVKRCKSERLKMSEKHDSSLEGLKPSLECLKKQLSALTEKVEIEGLKRTPQRLGG